MNADCLTADWADLELELDAWGGDGHVATLWWRDDDAVRVTPALERLLGVAGDVPLALAVVPGLVSDREGAELARRLALQPNVSVLQHGFKHVNHAPPDERKAELGAHRPLAVVRAELAAGFRRLTTLFGRVALPVLTPPWNGIAPALLPLLRDDGYLGISTAGPRRRADAVAGLAQVNTHGDLVAWPARRFVGTATALGHLVGHLRARRCGAADPAEATGLLTHHIVQDAATDDFIARLLAMTRSHPAARWLGAAEAFADRSLVPGRANGS